MNAFWVSYVSTELKSTVPTWNNLCVDSLDICQCIYCKFLTAIYCKFLPQSGFAHFFKRRHFVRDNWYKANRKTTISIIQNTFFYYENIWSCFSMHSSIQLATTKKTESFYLALQRYLHYKQLISYNGNKALKNI